MNILYWIMCSSHIYIYIYIQFLTNTHTHTNIKYELLFIYLKLFLRNFFVVVFKINANWDFFILRTNKFIKWIHILLIHVERSYYVTGAIGDNRKCCNKLRMTNTEIAYWWDIIMKYVPLYFQHTIGNVCQFMLRYFFNVFYSMLPIALIVMLMLMLFQENNIFTNWFNLFRSLVIWIWEKRGRFGSQGGGMRREIKRQIGKFENLFKTKMVLFAARVIRSAWTNNTMYTQPAKLNCSEYSVAIFNLTNNICLFL